MEPTGKKARIAIKRAYLEASDAPSLAAEPVLPKCEPWLRLEEKRNGK